VFVLLYVQEREREEEEEEGWGRVIRLEEEYLEMLRLRWMSWDVLVYVQQYCSCSSCKY